MLLTADKWARKNRGEHALLKSVVNPLYVGEEGLSL